MWTNPQKTMDLVTFTKKTLNGKRQFLCSEYSDWLPTVTSLSLIKQWVTLNI